MAAAAWVGLVSYGLYLWHLDVLKQLSEHGAGNAAIVIGGSALALAVGAASWYVVERRSIALGRRVAGRPPAPREAGRPEPTTAETVGR